MRRKHFAAAAASFALASVLVPMSARAQQHQHGAQHEAHAEQHTRPAGWMIRADDAGADLASLYFVDMAPGWHVTTGPSVVLYHPDSTAAGTYAVEVETFLFDPGDRNEAFGLLVGGRGLDGADQAYTYFLIRRDGSYTIKRRSGADTPTVVPWTPHAAIAKWERRAEGDATVKNVLRVEVGEAEVRFLVNGQPVHTLARERVDYAGIVGLRINHALNLHITKLHVSR